MAIEFSINPVVTTVTQQSTNAPQPVQQTSKPAPELRQAEPASGQRLPQADGTDSPKAKKDAAPTPADVNHYAQSLQRKMVFSVDPVTGAVVVKIVNAMTNEVIREIPEDEVPALVRQLEQVQGLLLKAKA